jgi:hypothetical protein
MNMVKKRVDLLSRLLPHLSCFEYRLRKREEELIYVLVVNAIMPLYGFLALIMRYV